MDSVPVLSPSTVVSISVVLAFTGSTLFTISLKASTQVGKLAARARRMLGGKHCQLLHGIRLLSNDHSLADAGLRDGVQVGVVATDVPDWSSSTIPETIRVPWRVFEEHLEERMRDAAQDGLQDASDIKMLWARVQTHGARSVFLDLSGATQKPYVEVSLDELSAFVHWRRIHIIDHHEPASTHAEWDALGVNVKADWIPQNPRKVLAADQTWAPLNEPLLPLPQVIDLAIQSDDGLTHADKQTCAEPSSKRARHRS
eukprot:TRINITY_DN14273_c0_g1_i1.p1 TRINITY_DN14273_c0_g1~~TRINITY_DN14273_c0_g1_i1.p1  ORF type:complete len:257 (-),score=34.15 TRINITY_DN14273_c0_g1_i1:63-833(-)